MVIGDTESGKSNLLRLIGDTVVRTATPQQARIIVVDYRRSLYDAVTTDHLIGYAASRRALDPIINDVLGALKERLPGPDVTPDQLRSGRWWKGADLYLLVDDYDLVATGAANPLQPLLELLPQARDIGLHLVLARRSGGAGRALFEPVLQRLKEIGTPALLLSGSRDEGVLFGDVRLQAMSPGRGTLVSRRVGNRVVQTALMSDE